MLDNGYEIEPPKYPSVGVYKKVENLANYKIGRGQII